MHDFVLELLTPLYSSPLPVRIRRSGEGFAVYHCAGGGFIVQLPDNLDVLPQTEVLYEDAAIRIRRL